MLDKEFKEKAFKQLKCWSIDDLVELIKLYEKDDTKGFQEKIDKVQDKWKSIKDICPYCNLSKPIMADGNFKLTIYWDKYKNKYYLQNSFYEGGGFDTIGYSYCELDYCPKCGRKLRGLNE